MMVAWRTTTAAGGWRRQSLAGIKESGGGRRTAKDDGQDEAREHGRLRAALRGCADERRLQVLVEEEAVLGLERRGAGDQCAALTATRDSEAAHRLPHRPAVGLPLLVRAVERVGQVPGRAPPEPALGLAQAGLGQLEQVPVTRVRQLARRQRQEEVRRREVGRRRQERRAGRRRPDQDQDVGCGERPRRTARKGG